MLQSRCAQSQPESYLTPSRADAVWTASDFELACDLEALAVEADDGERMVDHALRQQGLAITAPDHALGPLSNLDLSDLRQRGSVYAEYDEQAVIVIERMARRQV